MITDWQFFIGLAVAEAIGVGLVWLLVKPPNSSSRKRDRA